LPLALFFHLAALLLVGQGTHAHDAQLPQHLVLGLQRLPLELLVAVVHDDFLGAGDGLLQRGRVQPRGGAHDVGDGGDGLHVAVLAGLLLGGFGLALGLLARVFGPDLRVDGLLVAFDFLDEGFAARVELPLHGAQHLAASVLQVLDREATLFAQLLARLARGVVALGGGDVEGDVLVAPGQLARLGQVVGDGGVGLGDLRQRGRDRIGRRGRQLGAGGGRRRLGVSARAHKSPQAAGETATTIKAATKRRTHIQVGMSSGIGGGLQENDSKGQSHHEADGDAGEEGLGVGIQDGVGQARCFQATSKHQDKSPMMPAAPMRAACSCSSSGGMPSCSRRFSCRPVGTLSSPVSYSSRMRSRLCCSSAAACELFPVAMVSSRCYWRREYDCKLAHTQEQFGILRENGYTAATMKNEKLRRALMKLPNVVQFCEKHDLALRTVMRARVKGVSLSKSTVKLISLALTEEGMLSGDQPTTAKRVAGRQRKKVGGRG
jgi:hypothetical protein